MGIESLPTGYEVGVVSSFRSLFGVEVPNSFLDRFPSTCRSGGPSGVLMAVTELCDSKMVAEVMIL